MTDRILQRLNAMGNFPSDMPEEERWDAYERRVCQLGPADRKRELIYMDEALGELSPTREAASAIQRRRRIQTLHDLMLRAGR